MDIPIAITKPHITLDNSEGRFELQRVLGIQPFPTWLIIFPGGYLWWAHSCARVRESIAAWNSGGPEALDKIA